jgi:hypothetical protein
MLFASALTALAFGALLNWYMRRRWARHYVNPKNLSFPKVCPVCLKPANVLIEHDSKQRVTADAVIFREVEWLTTKIPHCSQCQRKQVRDLIIGLSLAAGCVLSLFIFAPTPDDPRDVILYFFFAYPFYVVANNLQEGIALGKWGGRGTVLPMRIRHPEYLAKMIALNSAAVVQETPLGGNQGVWRR